MKIEKQRFCLIGGTLKHSWSAELHAHFGYSYALKELAENGLPAFVKSREFAGFNVTIPFKGIVMPLLDALDASAAAAGAVNTVVLRDGLYTGYNTDTAGMAYMLRRAGIGIAGKKVLVLGSGGTSRTAQSLCETLDAKSVTVVSRSGENHYGNMERHADADVLINTTPAGMYPHNGGRLVDLACFQNLSGVADVIYNPFMTDLIFQAKERGIPCASGLPMLVAQAKAARDLFLGKPAPDGLTEDILRALIRQKLNIVLIGMPSSGKTTVGQTLARLTGKTFTDTDKLVEQQTGMAIPDLFAKHGEAHFRALESACLAATGKEHAQIIATGGGAVENPGAYQSLKQNAVVVHLTRPKHLATTAGRPLLADPANYEKLYAHRLPVYQKFADGETENTGTPEQTAKAIIRLFDKAADKMV